MMYSDNNVPYLFSIIDILNHFKGSRHVESKNQPKMSVLVENFFLVEEQRDGEVKKLESSNKPGLR